MTLQRRIIRLAYNRPDLRPHLLPLVCATATPLPSSFPKNEIGLMTLKEFLKFNNPKGKYHPSDAYDFDLMKMNQALSTLTFVQSRGVEYTFWVPYGGGSGVFVTRDGKPFAVLAKNTLYIAHPFREKDLRLLPPPLHYGDQVREALSAVQRTKTIKYPEEYIPLISNVAARNRRKYPHLLQNLTIKGERFQLRAEAKPQKDKGSSLAILNVRGEIVAEATNEWGATLLVVAQEYRSMGLGTVLGKYWYRFNPSFGSGGFTPQGEALAVRRWEERVREFFSRGWYSELVKQRKITPTRVKEIASGLSGKRPPVDLPKHERETPVQQDVLVYVDDPTFVVYDSRFLQDQDEKWILGFGFFRDSQPVGVFLFRIDYEKPYRKLTTSVALQMARDNGDPIYVGEGYGDILEPQGLPVQQDGDYLQLTRNVLNLQALGARERAARRPHDRYGEIKSLLLEAAESKW